MGHPTLGGGLPAASIVGRFANDLRPPHRNEGFHDVLRCRGDHDLSEAVTLLSTISFTPSTAIAPQILRPPPRSYANASTSRAHAKSFDAISGGRWAAEGCMWNDARPTKQRSVAGTATAATMVAVDVGATGEPEPGVAADAATLASFSRGHESSLHEFYPSSSSQSGDGLVRDMLCADVLLDTKTVYGKCYDDGSDGIAWAGGGGGGRKWYANNGSNNDNDVDSFSHVKRERSVGHEAAAAASASTSKRQDFSSLREGPSGHGSNTKDAVLQQSTRQQSPLWSTPGVSSNYGRQGGATNTRPLPNDGARAKSSGSACGNSMTSSSPIATSHSDGSNNGGYISTGRLDSSRSYSPLDWKVEEDSGNAAVDGQVQRASGLAECDAEFFGGPSATRTREASRTETLPPGLTPGGAMENRLGHSPEVAGLTLKEEVLGGGVCAEGGGVNDGATTVEEHEEDGGGGGLQLSDGEVYAVLEDMFGGLIRPENLDRVFVGSVRDLEEVHGDVDQF